MSEQVFEQSYGEVQAFVVSVGSGAEVAMPTPTLGNPDAITLQTPDTNTGNVACGKAGVLADWTTGALAVLRPDRSTRLLYTQDENLKLRASAAGQTVLVTYYYNK